VTSTIESDGLRSGRNRGMATIRDRLGHMFATQRFGSIQYLLIKGNLRPVCWPWEEELDGEPKSSVSSPGFRSNYNPVCREHRVNSDGRKTTGVLLLTEHDCRIDLHGTSRRQDARRQSYYSEYDCDAPNH
jgi:hypothetical protein